MLRYRPGPGAWSSEALQLKQSRVWSADLVNVRELRNLERMFSRKLAPCGALWSLAALPRFASCIEATFAVSTQGQAQGDSLRYSGHWRPRESPVVTRSLLSSPHIRAYACICLPWNAVRLLLVSVQSSGCIIRASQHHVHKACASR